MENIFSPQLDIPVSELEKIFFNAYSKETSGDPIGRSEMNKEYGIRDRWQCARASYLSESLIENLRTVSQKVIIKKPSEELLDTLLRNSHKVKRLKHYYNILPDGRVLDFTHKQLAYRGDIVFGEKISELSLEETFSISEKQG